MQVIPFLFVTGVVEAKDNTLLNYKSQHSMPLLRNRSPGFRSRIAPNPDPQFSGSVMSFPISIFHHFKNSKNVAIFKIKKKMFALIYPVIHKEKQNKQNNNNNNNKTL